MTRLIWNAVGERFYESGVDRGVLYINREGFSWPGLVSVAESPSGGEATPYYIDGYKYLNIAASEEFEATIEAYSAPPAFAQCDGINTAYNGLLITQQPRRPFGFSYRSRLGNDVDGLDHGYKIHLVYNALAAPSGKTHKTVSDSPEASAQSWNVTTLPPKISGFRPTAHFAIDSRATDPDTMVEIEDLLYGTDLTTPTLPTVAQLMNIFGAPVQDGGELSTPVPVTIMDGGLP